MNTIRFLLETVFKLAIMLLIAVAVWWLVTSLYPSLHVRNLLSSTGTSTDEGWLPSPREYKGLFGNGKVPSATENVYVPGEAYNGYGNAYNGNQGGASVDFVTYTSTGTQIIHGGSTSSNDPELTKKENGYNIRISYIRNLSMYTGGHVYTGLTFTGDARDVMFQNGKFQIIVADPAGRPVAVSTAVAVGNSAFTGWTKFQAVINQVLPSNIPCTLVFEQGVSQYQYTYSNSATPPVRVAVPVICN